MKEISKGKAIELITIEIDKGTPFEKIFNLIGPKWALPRSTFKVYYKEAKELHQKVQADIRSEARSNKTVQEIEQTIEDLFTKLEYVIGLKKIWEGEPFQNKYPNFKDRLQAGKQAAELFGWEEPKRKDIKITGNPLDNLQAENKLEVIDSLPSDPKEFKKLK